jgi:hypothetical protein
MLGPQNNHMPIYFITCRYILSHANLFLSQAGIFYHMPIYFITCWNILSHADLFYHMPDHYESYLVIMPPFGILSLHNAESPVEYKREAEFCTLVSSPLRISPTFTYSLLGLACTYSHCNSRLLSSYYLSFCLDIVNPWFGQLSTLR